MTKMQRARKAKGMTVYDLAAEVGLTPGAISRIERGIRSARPANAKKLAEVLDLPIEDVLFPETESPETQEAATR